MDNGNAALTLHHLKEHFFTTKSVAVENSNIKIKHIGQKGLHLNPGGDDDELFLPNSWPTKDFKPYFQSGPLSEIFTIANFRHFASRISTSAEPEFRLCWRKLCSSDSHYTTAPQTKETGKLSLNFIHKMKSLWWSSEYLNVTTKFCISPTIIHKIFKTTGKVQFLFFSRFLPVLIKFSFHLGNASLKFCDFLWYFLIS